MAYIKDAFFVNFASYDNIGGNFYINIFLLVVFAFLCLGSVVLTVYKNSMHRIVKQLRRHKAYGEDGAKTLKELGLHDYRVVRNLLGGDGRIRRMVKRVGEVNYSYDEYRDLTKKKKLKKDRLDFTKEKFYLIPSESDRALLIENTYFSGPLRCVLTVVLLLIIYVTLMLIMPELLNFIDGIIGG